MEAIRVGGGAAVSYKEAADLVGGAVNGYVAVASVSLLWGYHCLR